MVEVEAWRTIAGFAGKYQVSDKGRVRSFHKDPTRGVTLKLFVNKKNGYLYVTLSGDGGRRTATVHTLVAATFLGPRPAGQEVRHLDGDPANAALINLKYGTPAENAKDKRRHGRHQSGERSPQARLTWESVSEMRQLYAGGAKQRDLATRFGVTHRSVSLIVRNKQWRTDGYGNPIKEEHCG